MNYGFIGFGNLATAIYQGLKNEDNLRFAYFDQIRKNVELPFLQLEELTAFADVIFLTVKPQNLTEVLQQLQPLLERESRCLAGCRKKHRLHRKLPQEKFNPLCASCPTLPSHTKIGNGICHSSSQ